MLNSAAEEPNLIKSTERLGVRRFNWTTGLMVFSMVLIGLLSALDWTADDGGWRTLIAMSVFLLICAHTTPQAGFLYGLVLGCVSLGAAFWWAQDMLAYTMNQEGWLPKFIFTVMVLWESLIFACTGCWLAKVRKSNMHSLGVLQVISLWILVETFQPRIFRWTLGHSQFGVSTMMQLADLGGGTMVSLMVLILASLPLLAWDLVLRQQSRRKASRHALLLNLIILASMWIYGSWRIRSIDVTSGQPLIVGVVQEDPSSREGLSRMREQSLNMANVDLLVWPESTLGVHSTNLTSFADEDQVYQWSKPPMIDSAQLLGLPAPVILGGRSFVGDREQESAQMQTAFLLDTDGSISLRYHKRSLMPLGEYVPGQDLFPWLVDLFQMGEQFMRGTSDAPLVLKQGHEVGVIVCYEDTVAEVVRRTVIAGAGILVCIINDSAFESEIALQQHMRLSRLRAIENRRYLVRSAGTGVSCVIDPVGNVLQDIPAGISGAFQSTVYLRQDNTLFQWFGEWPPLLVPILALVLSSVQRLRLGREKAP